MKTFRKATSSPYSLPFGSNKLSLFYAKVKNLKNEVRSYIYGNHCFEGSKYNEILHEKEIGYHQLLLPLPDERFDSVYGLPPQVPAGLFEYQRTKLTIHTDICHRKNLVRV